jgi:sulfocyanin SoxE-like protein
VSHASFSRSVLVLAALLGVRFAGASPADAQGLPAWVTADSAARTVHLALNVTRTVGEPSARLAGAREGGAQVVVPLGWTVTWDWRNADSTSPHSLVVMQEREKLPIEGGRPPFTNAMTKSLSAGLAAGQSDHTSFEADQVGWYWLLCGVPGHALQGEWLGLKVDADAKTAGVALK